MSFKEVSSLSQWDEISISRVNDLPCIYYSDNIVQANDIIFEKGIIFEGFTLAYNLQAETNCASGRGVVIVKQLTQSCMI